MHAISRRTGADSDSGVESDNRIDASALDAHNTLGNAEILDRMALESTPEVPAPTPATVPTGVLGDVYRDHQATIPGMEIRPTSGHKWAMEHFRTEYAENEARYAAVAEQTGVPAKLIAALHYRESSMDFGTYLHQGDPLGKQAVHEPSNIPVFDEWEEGAVHALNQKRANRDALGMDATTTDPAALATYAEAYNGLGYHNRGVQSSYVYSGTDAYQGGKYVADHKYDSNVWDSQPGVMALMSSLEDADGELPDWALPQKPEEAWGTVVSGDQRVREGQRGPAVEALQGRLAGAGFEVGSDGDFGPQTRKALIAFQKAHGLDPDGIVGPATAAALEATHTPVSEAPATETPATDVPQSTENAPSADAPEAAAADPWRERLAAAGTLAKGAKGDAVRDLQSQLAAAGHDVSLDGDFGPKTRAALRAFQRAHGLDADGILGPKTLAAL